MQNEIGVHRVQRVPTTSSSGTIHTSTAAVIVMPQPTEVNLVLKTQVYEIFFDIVCSSLICFGKGGY